MKLPILPLTSFMVGSVLLTGAVTNTNPWRLSWEILTEPGSWKSWLASNKGQWRTPDDSSTGLTASDVPPANLATQSVVSPAGVGIDGLTAATRTALTNANNAWRASGHSDDLWDHIPVGGAKRTQAQQNAYVSLWTNRPKGASSVTGNVSGLGTVTLVAAPATSSNHVKGTAVDFNGSALTWMKANGSRFGFYNDVPGDSVHFDFKG